jgi:hypothetical protein
MQNPHVKAGRTVLLVPNCSELRKGWMRNSTCPRSLALLWNCQGLPEEVGPGAVTNSVCIRIRRNGTAA